MNPSPTRSPLLWAWVFLAAIVALAAFLRALCMSSELWLDEVWSWEFARTAATPWEIFTGPNHHHDNNHQLNTLYLFFIPDGAPFAYYRLHSFAAGVASVLLAFRAAARRGALEGLFAALLVAVNYWFVLCSAEARGYALAMLFALAAFDGLQRYLRDGGRWHLAQFQIAVILGFLSHLSFLHAYLALAVWSVYHAARNRAAKGPELVHLLRIHGIPLAVLGGYFGLLRVTLGKMELGGAAPMTSEEQALILGRLLCVGFGLDVPLSLPKLALAAVAAFVVYVRGFQVLRGFRDDSWVFFAMVIVGAPLMLVAATRPPFLYERYFFLPFLFLLVLLAYVLADLARRSTPGRVVAGVVLGFVCLANFGEVEQFVRGGGRGHFQELMAEIVKQNGGATTISSDSDSRVPKMLAFYNHYVQPPLRYEYVKLDEWREDARLCGYVAGPGGRWAYSQTHAAEWVIVERPEHGSQLADKFSFPEAGDAEYELFAAYEVAAFGGWDWYVYRRVGGP